MAKKKEVYRVKPLNENKKNIIAALIDEYDNVRCLFIEICIVSLFLDINYR